MRFLAVFLLAAVFAVACASGGSDPREGAPRDGSAGDTGLPVDAGPRRDAGGCRADQHLCGATCTPDGPNDPERGCQLGCGDPCPTPAGGVAMCTETGQCDFSCPAPSMRVGDACSCEPSTCEALSAECGMVDDTCGGMIECGACAGGAACNEGLCGCTADAAEPNDSQITTHSIGAFNDASDRAETFAAFNLSAEDDVDWYVATVTDGSDGGNPQIQVDLAGFGGSSDYDLAAWYVCDSGTNATTCDAGAPDSTVGLGCRSDSLGATLEQVRLATDCAHIGFNDSGRLFVRVEARTWNRTCEPYSLTVDVY